MKIPNNQDAVAKKINSFNLDGVEAVGDDGNVCVQVSGSRERVWDVAKWVESLQLPLHIGDGAQEGDIFINGDEAGIHADLSDVVSIF